MNNKENITPYSDINTILLLLSEGIQEIFGNKLIGLYLTGSLTYGDFDYKSSDIDFLVVLKHQLSDSEFNQIKDLHEHINKTNPRWAQRIEGSYITQAMLKSITTPSLPRPYVNEGTIKSARYGNEWLLNLFALYESGLALVGPHTRNLLNSVDITLVREASKQDLYKEWLPLLNDPSPLNSSHYQAYVTLTLCRILHRLKNDTIISKRGAATWVKAIYGKRWTKLIEKAESWHHSQTLYLTNEILEFIRFTLKEIEYV